MLGTYCRKNGEKVSLKVNEPKGAFLWKLLCVLLQTYGRIVCICLLQGFETCFQEGSIIESKAVFSYNILKYISFFLCFNLSIDLIK